MWKNFLYFTKSQRVGIILLMVLTMLAFLFGFFLKGKKNDLPETDQAFQDNLSQFQKSLTAKEQERANTYQTYPIKNFPNRKYIENKNNDYELFVFDPNTADSISFIRLGLTPFIVRNILKYRAKGGYYKTRESFKKMYGLSEDKYKELAPYIQITATDSSSKSTKRDSLISTKKDSSNFHQKFYTKKTSYLDSNFVAPDINRADTNELMQIVGIGSYYAKQIVYYRKALGGYYSVEQLREIRNMSDDNFERIKHSLTANGDSIRKININFASIERMKSHPYINTFVRAKAIEDLRKSKGKIKTIEELNQLEIFSEEELTRLIPYIDFK